MSDLVLTEGLELQIANTSAPAWRWSNTKRKTDRDDALRLAQLSAVNQLPQVPATDRATRQWRALIRYRHHLVGRRTQILNHIRALFDREGIALPKAHLCWTRSGIAALREEARRFAEVEADQLWRGELLCELDALQAVDQIVDRAEKKLNAIEGQHQRCQLLRTIPAVGSRLAEIVVAVLGDPRRFSNGKEIGSDAGLTPRQYQSGDIDWQGRISRQGNRLLRAMLVEVSWVSLRYNEWLTRCRRRESCRRRLSRILAYSGLPPSSRRQIAV